MHAVLEQNSIKQKTDHIFTLIFEQKLIISL